MTFEFSITPVPKPRMTRRDKWAERPIVMRFRAYKDELKLNGNLKGLKSLTGKMELHFIIPMPSSWSKKRMAEMNGKPHQPKDGNDIDNLAKGILDTFESNDSFVYDLHATKYWGYEPKITIITYDC